MAWITEWWNQVSGTTLHGLELTVAGMVMVFFTLGLVILAMVLLTKLPRLQAKAEPEQQMPPEPVNETAEITPASQDDELARVAAIAFAMLQSPRRTSRRTRHPAARSGWKSYGRAQMLDL